MVIFGRAILRTVLACAFCCCTSAASIEGELTSASQDQLIGYTLAGYDASGTYYSSRAVVLNLKTGHSFEVYIPEIPARTNVSAYFLGWLPNKRAIVQISDVEGTFLDQYIVDFNTNRYFSATLRGSKDPYNHAQPYRKGAAIGYFASVGGKATLHPKLEWINADGGGSFFVNPGFDINIHGCPVSPNGDYLVCENTCNAMSCQAAVKIEGTNPFKFVVGRNIGPAGIGALWATDSSAYVYYSTADGGPDKLRVVLVDVAANFQQSATWSLGCKDSGCKDMERHVGAAHDSSVPCDWTIGSDLGAWAEGNMFYTSVVASSKGVQYNRIGRAQVKRPYKEENLKFDLLSPEGVNARNPAPAPTGKSFAYVGTQYKGSQKGADACESPKDPDPQEGPQQIYLQNSDGSTRRLTHVARGWRPADPKWRPMADFDLGDLPETGVGAGTFKPATCLYCGVNR